ncbi:MAG: polyhydroxyalkanoate synthesis regulator phasin, partial [Halioglobus sp.]
PDDLTTQGTLKDGFLSILGAAIEGFVIEDAEKSRRHSEAELSEIRSSIQEGFAAMIPSGEKGGEVQRIINDNLPKDIGSMPVDESGKRQFESRITEHITRCIQTLLKDSEVPAHETVTEIVDAIRADLSVAVDEARTIGVEADKIEQLLKSYLNFSEAEIPEQAGLESFKLIKKIEIEGWLDTFKVTHRIDLKSQAVDQMDLLKANVTEKNRDHIGELRDQGVEEGNYMPLLQILFPRVPDKPFTEADMEFLVDQIPKTFRELTQQFIPAVAVVGVSYVESEGVLKQGLKDTMTKMYRKRFSQLSFKPYSFDNNTRRVPDDAKTRPFEFMNQFCDDYVRACFEAEGFTTPEANFLIELNKKAISSLAVPDGIDLAVLRGKLADKESLLYMRNIPQSQEPTPFETEFTEKFKREIVDVMDRGETVSQRTLEEFQQLVLKRQPGLEVNYGNIANQVGVDTTVRTIFARTLPYNVLPCSASTSDYNIRVGNLDSYIPGEVMVGEQKLLTYTDRRGEEYVFMGASALHGGHYHHHSIVGNDLKEDLQSGMGGQRMRDLTTSNLRNVLSRGRELDIVLVKKDVVEKVLAEKPDFFTSFNRDSSTEWFGNNCWFVQGIQRGYMMYKMNEALGSSDA